jgi:hypothetical protein
MIAAILFLFLLFTAQTILFTEINFLFAAVRLLLPAFPKAMKGTYTISPLSSLKIEPFLTGMTGFFFSAAEFHPRVVSPPPVSSMSFDDLLKGVAQ